MLLGQKTINITIVKEQKNKREFMILILYTFHVFQLILQMQQRSKRNSIGLNRHQSSVSFLQQIQIGPLQLQKFESSIETVSRALRIHLKQHRYTFEANELKDLYRGLSYATKSLSKIQQALTKSKQQKQSSIKELTTHYEQLLLSVSSEHSQQIMRLTAEYGQQEQTCKLLVANFVQTLAKAQQCISSLHCRADANAARVSLTNQANKRYMQELLRRVKRDQDDISLDCDALAKQLQSPIKIKSVTPFTRIETCFEDSGESQEKKQLQDYSRLDASSIVDKPIQENQQEQTSDKIIQDSVFRLMAFGFFTKANAENVQRLISLSEEMNEYYQIYQNEKYSLIMEMIKIAILPNETTAWRILNGQMSQNVPNGVIGLRNVQNISQLSIADSVQK